MHDTLCGQAAHSAINPMRGIQGMTLTEAGVNIEINSGASKRAGLDIGTQLLQRATLVADARSDVKP
jgi:hypothetical protein